MRRRARIIVGSLLIILVVFIVVLALPQRVLTLPITVSFLGYTNDTKGSRLARFAVTNHSDATIRRWGVFHPESYEQPSLFTTVHLGPNVFLMPNQSEIISIPAPTNQEAWRLVLDFSRDGRRLKFSDWMGRGSGGLIHAIVPDRWRGIPTQFVRSDWIDQ